MKKKITMLCLLAMVPLIGFSQWQSLNPGAGGQVQDIVCDPNTPNRVFLASDMEGIYESTDNGQTWKEKGYLKQNRVYAIAVTPGNSNKMFVGTLYGLEVSNDGGNNFNLVGASKRFSIGAIGVSPANPNNVIAGVGWRDDNDFASNFGMSQNGNIITYRSTNGGSSWTKVEISGSGNRNVYTIQFDPNNANVAYMGTSQGVFKTTNAGSSWFALGNNPGTNSGVALSPNGQTLYGTFNHDLYVTSTSSINWQSKMSGLNGSAKYWYPEVDPRSTGSSHKVTMAILGDRPGLYEGTFNWSGNSLSNYSWKKIWEGTSGYDTGWDVADPNPRVAHYTPTSWSRAIWSTTNQTIFQATPNGSSSGWGWNWNNKYSVPNNNFSVGGSPTYSSRGTASTYTYDIAVQDNYVLQSMADNGWVESWDGGNSWSNLQMRWKGQQSDAQSAAIGYDNGKYIAITESSPSCYGGYCFGGGRLWMKILNTKSPSDEWNEVADSYKASIVGFPNSGQYRDIAISPAKKDRLFAASNDHGLYLIDDIWAAANGASIMQFIGMSGVRVKKIAPHPTNPDVVFLTSNTGGDQGLFKGVKNGSNWNFSKIYSGSGWDAEVSVWEHNGQVYVFYFADIGGEFKGVLSLNEGNANSWNTVITSATAKSLRTPSWYSAVSEDFRFSSKGGIAGHENQIIVNYYDHRQQQTYGIFKGTISGSNVSWQDWTGDIHFGGATSGIVAKGLDGKTYFYASTAGAGAIRRELSSSGTNPTAPAAPSNLSTNATSSSQINLSWSDNSNNESGFKIERKQGSGSFSQITTVNAGITSYNNTGLNPSTNYTYRVRAYNASGNSSFSNTSSATTNSGGGGGCNNANLIQNGEFNDGTNNWTLYNNTSGSPSASVVTDAGMSGSNAIKINISSSAMGNTDNDIQFFSPTGNLDNGKTYQVTFKAKATGNRSMRLGVLQSASPWNNYLTENINLTTSTQDFGPFEFTMTETSNNSRIDFFVGGNSKDIFIDKIEVKEKCSGSSTVPVISVGISGCNSSVTVGSSFTLTANVNPSNASNKNVSWSSSNNSVATVNSSGTVTANATGSSTITVTTADGNKTATCKVTVTSNGGSTTAYRYLRLTGYGTVQNEVTLQQIHWMVGSSSYPNPKITWNTQSQVTSSNNASSDYAAYDNTNGGWNVGTSYPAWIKIDLGAGNEIAPDEIRLKANADNRGFSSFECHGSNDNSNWTLLHSESGLTPADYPSTWGVFPFSGTSSKSTNATAEVFQLIDSNFSVYPNPLPTDADLYLTATSGASFDLVIYNVNGTQVFHNTYNESTQKPLKIDLKKQLATGVYFIKYISENEEITKKLIIK
ncbi:Ig-like domain-containing protein [Galbibacter sp. BG1]|uniref:Ig-like domain-containing protein n=1 Tax=Galbibacter sp. BG1 TaxID=1170699 RepID=UPI0015BB0745|nr:Ig-like domain-containing protein [Galbibacter sp. BG1]QLE02217.1 Ig-like domain-containing protein [Galbibacter sp. BG1]